MPPDSDAPGSAAEGTPTEEVVTPAAGDSAAPAGQQPALPGTDEPGSGSDAPERAADPSGPQSAETQSAQIQSGETESAGSQAAATQPVQTKPAEPPAPSTPPASAPEAAATGSTQASASPPPPPGPRPRPRPASIPDGVLTVEDHLEKILRGIGPLAPYDQPLVESLGLPLHEAFIARTDLPRFDNAAVDGYAVRAEDLAGASPSAPVVLPVVGEIAAGSAKPFAISAGTAVKIMTGAPIPHGADAVVPAGLTDRGHARVSIVAAPDRGANIRRQASDVASGHEVLAAGTVIGPREIALLASLGAPRIQARPRPRVVVLSTGAELREPGTHLDYDSVNDANGYMIAAGVRSAGAICYRVGSVDDNPKTFRRVLSDQLVRADLVVTSGGISEGDHEVVRETLSALGTVDFVKVAMQPGASQGFGRVFDEQTPLIAVPGNPVSAFVSFEAFVLPAIRRMMGRTPFRRPMVHAVLAQDVHGDAGDRQYIPGYFEVTHRGAKVTPLAGANPHLVGVLAQANALIIVGEDETALNMGDTVRTLVLDRPY